MANRNPFFIEPANASSPLQSLMMGYDAGQKRLQQAAIQRAGEMFAKGDIAGAQAAAAEGGSLQALMGFAGLNNNERDFAFRQSEALRSQENTTKQFGLTEKQINATLANAAATRDLANRQFGEQVRMNNAQLEGNKIPAGFEVDPTKPGALRPKVGGPQDPAYIESTRKPPNLGVTDIIKLSEEGGKFANISGFLQSFKPEFAGSPVVGEASNYLARTLPSSLTGQKERDAAAWWQEYDRHKNVVRHDLYGSALTKPEQAAFDRADIKPGMNPEIIQKNLQIQRQIVENGVKRKAGALAQGGYDVATIGKAFGMTPEQMGVRPKNAPPAQAAQNDPLGIR